MVSSPRPLVFFVVVMAFLCAPWSVRSLRAEVKLPTIFGDHMVLQQDMALPVWGTADPGEKVEVVLGPSKGTATAGPDGKWRVNLPALPAQAAPLTMTATGKNTLKFEDVLLGEVWFCSGQSNMATSMINADDATTAIAAATDPKIRYFHVKGGPGLEPSSALAVGEWELCSPEAAPKFSRVGYYFAKELRTKFDRPVGIIASAWGGTAIEPWTPLSGFENEPQLKVNLDQHTKAVADYSQLMTEYPEKQRVWHVAQSQWMKETGNAYNATLKAWQEAADKAKAGGQTPPPRPTPAVAAPQQPPHPNGGTGMAAGLFNGVVAPVVPYAIRGVAWYQGESNAGQPRKYEVLFPALIKGWRACWGRDDLPFLFVQLPKYIQGSNWPLMREVQAKALALPHTAMATAIDVGDPNNIHPSSKVDVAKRLELAAEHVAYGKKLVYSGPVYQAIKVEGNTARLAFTHTGGGLIIGTAPWTPRGVAPLPNTTLLGFSVAGADKRWVWADARIDGNAVLVSSPTVPTPVAVRYAWQNSPDCNLYNKEGLPAPPFRTDDWPDINPLPAAPVASPAK